MAKDRFPETWHGGETMKRLTVGFDDRFYANLKELAARHKTTMADLVRYAVDKTFEDQLDSIAADRSIAEDPQPTTSWEDFKKERTGAVPHRVEERNAAGSAKDSTTARAAHQTSNRRARKRAVS